MDEGQDSSSDDPLYSPRMEADPLDSLNNACLLNDSDCLFEEPGLSHEFSSTFVPETPRYRFLMILGCNREVMGSC